MRPRVFPAEDRHITPALASVRAGRFNEAAGIPRGRPTSASVVRTRPSMHASMRPRVFPAEDGAGKDSSARER